MNKWWNHLYRIKFFALDLIFWSLHLWLMQHFAADAINTLPATGGDTGSHFWAVVVLRDYGLSHFDFRPWNPANYAGEPLLVHYFPLPFIMMAVASHFIPAGLAFNLGTFLPVFLLSPAIWWSMRRLSLALGATDEQSRICGFLAGVLSYGVLFNDGNTMWGGNFFSVLAGQFAHQYAFLFLFLFIGVLPAALTNRRSWLWASLLFAAIILSHAYVALFLPMVFVGAICAFVGGNWVKRLFRLSIIGALGSALSAWFWWPLIDNSKWTTPYGFSWQFTGYVKELLPVTIAPSLVLLGAALILSCFIPRVMKSNGRGIAFWAPQIGFGVAGYFYFARLGLVDVRTVPHIHYAVACLVGFLVAGLAARCRGPMRWLIIATVVNVPWAQSYLIRPQVQQLQGWVKWNYSGWTVKEAYSSLQALSREISGTFDDPRVSFEHDGQSNIAGTPRVFEMLPYFAGRSVTDGVYMQSTILAPMSFYQQAAISKSPSCPFPNFPCTGMDIEKGLRLGRLMGIGTYIFSSSEVIQAVDKLPQLEFMLDAKPWRVYRDRTAGISNVAVMDKIPDWIDAKDWSKSFWKWFENYQGNEAFQVVKSSGGQPTESAFIGSPGEECHPKVKTDYSKIWLETPCPGRFHLLRYAYHSSWQATNGDSTYMVSPGFIGIVPSTQSVELRFGQIRSWQFVTYFSILTFLAMCTIFLSKIRFLSFSNKVR